MLPVDVPLMVNRAGTCKTFFLCTDKKTIFEVLAANQLFSWGCTRWQLDMTKNGPKYMSQQEFFFGKPFFVHTKKNA